MITILIIHAWTIYRGRYFPVLTVVVLVPAIIASVAFSFYQMGIVGALWSFPGMIALFFYCKGDSIFASIYMLAVIIPSTWFTLDTSLALRFA
ncbi:MAG: hypothetical protein OEW99_01620 [Gammaproteobacteria bacterium]|nr:hypothetical protein [Gammaproteobacteria bacterium]